MEQIQFTLDLFSSCTHAYMRDNVRCRGGGFEPGPPTRQSSAQTTMPIELSSIGKAVAGWLVAGCYIHPLGLWSASLHFTFLTTDRRTQCPSCPSREYACSPLLTAPECSNVMCAAVGFEPGPPVRQSSVQTTIPIELNSIGKAVAGWLVAGGYAYICMHACMHMYIQ